VKRKWLYLVPVAIVIAILLAVLVPRRVLWAELCAYPRGMEPWGEKGRPKCVRAEAVTAATIPDPVYEPGTYRLADLEPIRGYRIYWTERAASPAAIWTRNRFAAERPGTQKAVGGAVDFVHVLAGDESFLAEYDRRTDAVTALVFCKGRPKKADVWRYAMARLKIHESRRHALLATDTPAD
jgi:hypothetical protein